MGNMGRGKTPPEGTMEMHADAIERTHPSADPVRSAVDCAADSRRSPLRR
jgi:hypothetical protein